MDDYRKNIIEVNEDLDKTRDNLSDFITSLEFNHENKAMIDVQKSELTSMQLDLKKYEKKDQFRYKMV